MVAGEKLEPKYRDHQLSGNWKGHRDCHIESNWILIYRIEGENLIINSRRKIYILLSFGADKELDTSLNKLIVFQIAKYRANIEQLQLEFKSFEAKYKMSSEDFYNKFESGKLGDDADFFEWAGLY